MKKISVVTVCLNSERTVANALNSFQRQRYPNKEHLIIDGGSTDSTLGIIERVASTDVRIISGPDDGLFHAMNKGLDAFSGDAVGFLNSDDTFHDEYALERLASALEDADVAYGDLVMVRNQDSKNVIRMWRAGEYRKGLFRRGWAPPHPTFYMTRDVVEKIGRFDCRYQIGADYDLMLRVLELFDFRVRYIPHLLVDFEFGGRSTRSWRAVFDQNIECMQSRRAHFGSGVFDAALVLKPLRKLMQLRYG